MKDDVEHVRYKAMKYNQIISKIWRVAKKLLRQGKELFGEFEKGGFELTYFIKQMVDACRLEHNSDDPVAEDLQDRSKGSVRQKNRCPMNPTYSDAALAADHTKEIGPFEQKHIDGTISGGGEILGEPSCFIPSRVASNSIEDVNLDEGDHLKIKGTCECGPQFQIDVDAGEVDIKECTSNEVVRVDCDSQATENSSSFGCSLDEGERNSVFTGLSDSTEVQSRLRTGSGGLLSPHHDDLVGESDVRKKRALNQEWKAYRRGIEWRCRWLELRIKVLQDQASRYNHFLEERQMRKPWGSIHLLDATSASRTVPFTNMHVKQSLLHRKRRTKVEDTIDTAAFMSKHPLFSRYEKKKQEQDDPHEGMFDKRHFRLMEHASMGLEEASFPDESDMDEPSLLLKETLGEDSIEELLWSIESLQARVIKLRSQLNRGTHASSSEARLNSAWQDLQAKNLSPVMQSQDVHAPLASPRGILRPPRHRTDAGLSPVGPSKSASSNAQAQKVSGSAVLRRRTADYDISNVIMPVNVGAKYVEPVRHAKIETPRWTRLDESNAMAYPNGGCSSNEDTDDELYMEMHNRMEERERLHRMPHPLKRYMDITGTSTMCSVAKARGKVTSMDSIDLNRKGEDHDGLADDIVIACSASFPKRKRSRRDFKCNFTLSRGRKLLNIIPDPLDIKKYYLNGHVDIKNESVEPVPGIEAREGGIESSGVQTVESRHFCL